MSTSGSCILFDEQRPDDTVGGPMVIVIVLVVRG